MPICYYLSCERAEDRNHVWDSYIVSLVYCTVSPHSSYSISRCLLNCIRDCSINSLKGCAPFRLCLRRQASYRGDHILCSPQNGTPRHVHDHETRETRAARCTCHVSSSRSGFYELNCHIGYRGARGKSVGKLLCNGPPMAHRWSTERSQGQCGDV